MFIILKYQSYKNEINSLSSELNKVEDNQYTDIITAEFIHVKMMLKAIIPNRQKR